MSLIFIIFLICTILQLIWWLAIFSRLALLSPVEDVTQHSDPSNGEPNQPVSIIICSHNELSNLRRLIPKLVSQEYQSFEVIIVDDRSSDGTTEWLNLQQSSDSRIRLISITETPTGINPKKHALITGISAATHDKLLLTDADCIPVSNQWIKGMVAGYDNDRIEVILGFSGYYKLPGLLNALIRYETLITAIQYFSRAIAHKPYMGVGRNLSYRKSFFKRTGGLSNVMHITGGDDDLIINQYANGENTTISLHKSTFTQSHPETRWGSYFKQKLRHLSVGKHYKMADKWVLGIFSFTHIIFWSSLVSLLVAKTMVYWVTAGFLLRQFALSWVVEQSSRKLNEHIGILLVPLLDLLYGLFYLVTGLAALTTKDIRWR